MSDPASTLTRRVLALACALVTAGTGACVEAPTAPSDGPRVTAGADDVRGAKGASTTAAGRRRSGYNVVAD